MNIKDLISNADILRYKELCSALIERFGVKQAAKWDSVLPHEQQQTLFGGEILRLVSDHPTLANHKEIRPICLMKGELSQLLFFYVQLKDEKLPKSAIERITRKFIGGTAAERYVIWFLGNKNADVLKIVISGKEGKKVRQKTLTLEAGQWFKTYDYILSEVERKFNTGGLFQQFKEPSGLWKAVWEAFDISIVNKKFYAEIKEIFDALTKEYLPKCKGILTNDQDRVQFAIRLIGRIIFCWFLKRKSIVADDVMSSKAVQTQQNFYRDLLEPLFFDVFNTPPNERKKDLPALIKNYPFLNGGLFEPQSHDYKGNWALNIPNDWFMNFFRNTLERYNFTVDENSAASSEIAIDPEMLGRIFENLLAEHNPETGESARKATGSYYTPREIVDFMVEESLIAYLKTQKGNTDEAILTGVQPAADEAIEDFVHTGTFPDALKVHSLELLDKLNVIKVLDPACGSGAFPISMLQKLVGLKQQLDPKTLPYALKLKTIENSIYGVDIQPMATELSRLRCWLSLIVDEDPKDIKPLPNLDFKFVTANSLIDLGYDEFIKKAEDSKIGLGKLFLTGFMDKLNTLRAMRQKFFEPSLHQREKDKLKKEFNTIKDDLFKMSLELIKQKLLDAEFANQITGWDPFDDSKPAPFFNKSWMFGVEDGFDVVIANPPYISHDKIKNKNAIKNAYASYEPFADVYCYFLELALKLQTTNGLLCFITSNSYLRTEYGAPIRRYLKDNNYLLDLVNIEDAQVFDNAIVNVAVILSSKSKSYADYHCRIVNSQFVGDISFEEFIQRKSYFYSQKEFNAKSWNLIEPHILELQRKIESKGKTLEELGTKIRLGLATGNNDAFIIDEQKKNEFYRSNPKNSKIIKPILRGRDIFRYSYTLPGLYILLTKNGVDVKSEYPDIYKHLESFGEKFKSRGAKGTHWTNLRACSFFDDFKKEKIIWIELTDIGRFALCMDEIYLLNSAYFLLPPSDFPAKYLLGVLNSKVIRFYLNLIAETSGMGTNRWINNYVKEFPIPEASINNQKTLISLVDQVLGYKQKEAHADTTPLEREIDEMVYKLYDLTPEEIAIVEELSKR